MKKHLSYKTILPVLITILAFLVFWFNLTSTKYDLKGIKIDSVKIAGESYSVKDNKIFESGREIKSSLDPIDTYKYIKAAKLAIFYQNTKEDPIFTGPGIDSEKLSRSIDNLEKKEAELLSVLNFKDKIFPVEFLKDIIEVKKMENKFLAEPDYLKANELLKAYNATLNSYKEDANNLKKFLEKLPKNDKEIVQIGSVTTQEIIYKDLEKIIENASQLEREINNRKDGLSLFGVSKRIELKVETEKSSLSENELQSTLPIESLYLVKNNLEVKGPYEIISQCFSGNGEFEKELFYQTEDKVNNLSFPKLASTNYYSELPGEGGTLAKAYKKQGLTYRPQGETNSYNCNNLEYQVNVSLIDYFYQTYKNDQISTKLKGYISDKKINDIFLKEKEFFNAKYPSQEKLESLSEEYLSSYLLMREGALKEELLIRYLMIRTKYSNYHSIVNTFSYLLEMYIKLKKFENMHGIEDKGGGSAAYIYYIRSGYSLLYLSFSPSVWQMPGKLTFIKEGATSKNYEYNIKYDSLINKIGKEEILRINSIKREKIIEDLTKILSD